MPKASCFFSKTVCYIIYQESNLLCKLWCTVTPEVGSLKIKYNLEDKLSSSRGFLIQIRLKCLLWIQIYTSLPLNKKLSELKVKLLPYINIYSMPTVKYHSASLWCIYLSSCSSFLGFGFLWPCCLMMSFHCCVLICVLYLSVCSTSCAYQGEIELN